MVDAPAEDRQGGLVVALDGPGSSGKSSVGAAAAERLGYRFCDTGLLYRALTWLALARGMAFDDGPRLAAAAGRVVISPGATGRLEQVIVDGVDVTTEIQTGRVDERVSEVARLPEVRTALLERQRDLARDGGIIMAGRDIGTVVLPDADLKLYLDASVEERARRRTAQWGHPPDGSAAEEILAELRRRDGVDSSRPVAPLRVAPDAIVLRTDGNEFEETVDAVVDAIRAAKAGPAADVAPVADGEQAAQIQPAAAESDAAPTETGAAPARRVPSRSAAPGASRASNEPALSDSASTFIRLTDLVGRTIVRGLTRVRVEGLDNARGLTGPLLVACNHTSNADGVLLASWITPALGRRIHLLGKQEAVDWPVVGLALRWNGVFGIRRGAADLEAFRAAKRVLDEGHVLGVMPEGTRSANGELQEAKDGLAILALRTGAPILPVGMINTHRFWPRGKSPQFGGSVTIRVGKPFTLEEATRGLDRRAAQPAATTEIMRRIAELLPESQRGVYKDLVKATRSGT